MATAYLKRGSRKEALMDDVVHLLVEEGGVVVKALFGEQKCVEARIREVDFMSSTIILEGTDEEDAG